MASTARPTPQLIRTRSMSRRAPSSSGLSSRPAPSSTSFQPRRLPSSSSRSHLSSTASAPGPSRVLHSRRASLATAPAVADAGGGPEHGLHRSTTRPLGRPASLIGGMGLGTVRVGPTVVAQRSPPKKQPQQQQQQQPLLAGGAGGGQARSDDPFSLDFDPATTWASSSSSRRVTTAPLQETREDEDAQMDFDTLAPLINTAWGAYQETTLFRPCLPVSPTKRPVLPLCPTSPSKPFDLTSPTKPRSFDLLSPTKGRSTSPLKPPSHSLSPVYRMNVDVQNRPPSSPSRDPKRRKPGNENASSDDEIDFQSPRKKQRFGIAGGGVRSPSPTKPKVVASPAASAKGDDKEPLGPTSVPMSRPSYPLPPPFRNPAVVSASTPFRPVGIDPSLLEPRPAATAGLASKYASTEGKGPATFTSAFVARGLPLNSTYYSSTPAAASILAGAAMGAVVQAASKSHQQPQRSGIPRLAVPVTTARTPALVEDALPVTSRFPTPIDDDEEDTAGNLSTLSTASSMTEETAQRLANLNAMLSRLAMPRREREKDATQAAVSAANARLEAKGRSWKGTASAPVAAGGTHTAAANARRLSGAARDGPGRPTVSRSESLPTVVEAAVPSSLASSSAQSSSGLGLRPRLIANPSMPPPSLARRQTLGSRPSSTTARTAVPVVSATSTAIAAIETEMEAKPRSQILRGVVALVDVRTGDGDDAGMLFVDMLKSMGARVTSRSTVKLTHVVFKSGRPITLQRYHAQPEPKPVLVSIAWVVRCAELNQRVDEKAFVVAEGSVQALVTRRRRSMEPKALASLNTNVNTSATTSAAPTVQAHIAASIDRVRRKTLQFAPKVGSPLAKRVFTLPTGLEDATEDE